MKHIVGFSGGIDSQACARWVLNRFPKEDVILTNSNAGEWEHPDTMAFVDWYSENVHPVTRTNAIVADMWRTPGFAETRGFDGNQPLTFELMVKIKGRPPSRKAQFCTEKLKLAPQRRWMRENSQPGGLLADGYCRYTGVRRDESDARKNTAFQAYDDWFDCDLFYPLADWTKRMCFDYVKSHGEQINPLYLKGFNRVGCAPCVNSGKEDITNWAQRSPETIDKVRSLEESTGRTFFAPVIPGFVGNNFIDDVVRWAGSARGGRQDLFPIMHEREACESKYGLCE
jgi:3'-phosphoadenosine 5'-phosphosulfate sulfotransferase (PAPS reductase)/FAD synthetase